VSNLFIFFTALVISVALIPLMIRLAPRLGMVDQPDPRKVHTIPTPRVGGIGIVIGSLVSILLWVPLDHATQAYLFGAFTLLVFGLWDDSHELGHYVKFIGQFIAVVAVVYYGDIFVRTLPFSGLEPLPAFIGKPFTVFAIVGMINAINHSDGLDGLAGGLSVLSLGCIAYLASLSDGQQVVAIAMAALGGVLGFLRYNTYPAGVFMGDGGSQFLGYTLGYLAVLLTQDTNTALSPALPALLLGLPIIDILAVFVQRAYQGINWFRATRNHIHHRLLELGFDHYEAVVAIYSIQMLFVASAILLRYEADSLILSLYVGVCSLVFVFLLVAKNSGWRAHRAHASSGLAAQIQKLMSNTAVRAAPMRVLSVAVPAVIIFLGFTVTVVPQDFGIGAALLALISLLSLLFANSNDSILFRASAYITVAFAVYLAAQQPVVISPIMTVSENSYFALLAITIGLAVRFAAGADFKTNPLDYLLIFIVVSVGIFSHNQILHTELGSIVAKLMILFYGCELIISHAKSRWNALNLATLATLTMLSLRPLL
jgi:UDP-GlcNAc:undecaprenyl-phosphate/decaprenyl-phosphate GlcNAc-1-phosphate transferase